MQLADIRLWVIVVLSALNRLRLWLNFFSTKTPASGNTATGRRHRLRVMRRYASFEHIGIKRGKITRAVINGHLLKRRCFASKPFWAISSVRAVTNTGHPVGCPLSHIEHHDALGNAGWLPGRMSMAPLAG